jgi:hypothetical protein
MEVMGNLGNIQWGESRSNPRIYRGCGKRFISPCIPPPNPTMIFCKIMLWDSKDRGGTRIFKKG